MARRMKQKFTNGQKNNYQGGVLLVVLSLLLIFSTIFIYHIRSYEFNNQLNVNLQEFYQGEILSAATISKILGENPDLAQGEVRRGREVYNLGQVDYELRGERVTLEIELRSGKKTRRIISLIDEKVKDISKFFPR